MRKILHILSIILYFTTLLLLICSYLSVVVSPESNTFFAFCGLLYPIIFALNIIYLIYWIVRWRLFFICISAFSIIIGYSFFFDFIAFQIKDKPKVSNSVKVLTYNVRLFDVYRWEGNNEYKKYIFNFIYNENPDIICIQEFYNNKKMFGFGSTEKIINNTKAVNFHISNVFKRGNAEFGIATFTKYPIIKRGEFRFRGKTNVSIYTDVLINNDTVRIYNIHLESNRLGKEDYIFSSNAEMDIDNKYLSTVKNIFNKLKRTYIIRASEVDIISEHIRRSPYPVIVCGDFNDTPVSYTYNKISKNLTDAFINSGTGIGKTYIGNIPSFRIDYIFHSKKIKSSNFKIPNVKFSDHYPLTCNLTID